MAVKIHLKSGEYICSSCSAVVDEKSNKCPECGEALEGVVEESSVFKFSMEEETEDETIQVVRVFKMLSGSSLTDISYLDSIKSDLDELDAPTRLKNIIAIIHFYATRYLEINSKIDEVLARMRKEKKEEMLSDLDVLEELEHDRRYVLDRLNEINGSFSEFVEEYGKVLRKKETMLRTRIDEFQKEVERRKVQAKMLVEKEKELLEREHILREKEKALEKELTHIEESSRKLESDEISKEEWMEQQRRIQEKLYQLRQEVVKRASESEKEKLTKKVLKIIDELLGKLPDEIIEEFARSENFDLYKKVMEMYGLGGGSGSS